MSAVDYALRRLEDEEGFEGMPYTCPTGHLTVGFGTVLPLTPAELELVCAKRGMAPTEDVLWPIDEDEARLLLRSRFGQYETELVRSDKLGFEFSEMPASVRAALYDVAYNIGLPKLLKFRKTLAHLAGSRWADAAEELLDSRYARQVSNRAHRNADLIRRAGALPS